MYLSLTQKGLLALAFAAIVIFLVIMGIPGR